MGKLYVSRTERFGDRLLPFLSALRLGLKLDFPVRCFWKNSGYNDELKWENIFQPHTTWNREIFKDLQVWHKVDEFYSAQSIIPKCDIKFDNNSGYYIHTLPINFEKNDSDDIYHLSNPVGIYILNDENLSDVIRELSDLFFKLPFNDKIKEGFFKVDKEIINLGIDHLNSVSLHIRRGDVVDFAKIDGKALIERIVPLYEYEERVENLSNSMDLRYVLIGSDDPDIANRIDINSAICKVTLSDLLIKNDYKNIEFDIIDLYFISRSGNISSGFSAFSILSSIIGITALFRIDLVQNLSRRLESLSNEMKNDNGEIVAEWRLGLLSAYSHCIRSFLLSNEITIANKIAKKMNLLFPNNDQVHYTMGNICFLNKEYKKATRNHKKAISLNPTNSHYRLALAHAFYELEMFPESKKAVELSLFYMPDNQNAIRFLIKIYNKINNHHSVLLSHFYLSFLQKSINNLRNQIHLILKNIEDSEFGLLYYEKSISKFIESFDSKEPQFPEINQFIRESLLTNGSIFSSNIDDKINKSINENKLQRELLQQLEKNYNSKEIITFSTERFIDNNRAFIGGLADRMKGASTIMLLSIVMGRRFEIEWAHPEDISNIFVPKGYDWRVKNKSMTCKTIDLIDINFTKELRAKMTVSKIEKLLEIEEENVKIHCNTIEIGMSKNINYDFHKLNLFNQINRCNLVGSFSSILEYRPGLEESMILMLFDNYLKSFDCSIAIHFRTGGDGNWRDPQMDTVENIEKLFIKAADIINNIDGKCCIYFACDSAILKEKILLKYCNSFDIFSVNIPLSHLDRSSNDGAIMGSRYAVMENVMITLCDHILMGKGAFAELSANRIFKEPWRYYKN